MVLQFFDQVNCESFGLCAIFQTVLLSAKPLCKEGCFDLCVSALFEISQQIMQSVHYHSIIRLRVKLLSGPTKIGTFMLTLARLVVTFVF